MTQSDFILTKALLYATGLAMLGYIARVIVHGRNRSERVERQGSSLFLSKWMMEMGFWALQPAIRLAIRLSLSANTISYLAVLAGAIAGVALAYGHFGWAAVLGLLGSALDAMDGAVARETGTMSYAGKVLDSALDRYVEFFLFAGLVAFFKGNLSAQILALSAILASFMVSYTTALSEITDVRLPRGSMQRPERLVYLLLGILLSSSLSGGHSIQPAPLWIILGMIAAIGNASALLRLRFIRLSLIEREERLISLTLAQVRTVSTQTKPSSRRAS